MQRSLILIVAAARATGAIAAASPIAEADAARPADRTVAAWTSTDAARIRALYAPTIAGFDLAAAPPATDRATWDRLQDGCAAAGIDGAHRRERKIQIVDADAFVVSGRRT